MNSNEYRRNKRGFSATGLATVLLSASLAVAKSYDIAVDTMSLGANGVDRPMPAYADDQDARKGHEGRVHLNLVVAPDGRAINPVVVDSVGGEAFEQTGRAAIAGC